jgi:hypothetical protein
MGLELEYEYGQTPISEEEKEGLLIKTISILSGKQIRITSNRYLNLPGVKNLQKLRVNYFNGR